MRRSPDAYNEICHHVRNGLLVIRALCMQGMSGRMEPEEALRKIEHRAAEMGGALERISEGYGPKV